MTNNWQYLFHAFNLWNQITDSSQFKTTNKCPFVSNIPVKSLRGQLGCRPQLKPSDIDSSCHKHHQWQTPGACCYKCATVKNDTFSGDCKPGLIALALALLWIGSRTAAVRKACNNALHSVRLHTLINPAEGAPKSPCYQMWGTPILKNTRRSQRSNPQMGADTSLQLPLFCSKLLSY